MLNNHYTVHLILHFYIHPALEYLQIVHQILVQCRLYYKCFSYKRDILNFILCYIYQDISNVKHGHSAVQKLEDVSSLDHTYILDNLNLAIQPHNYGCLWIQAPCNIDKYHSGKYLWHFHCDIFRTYHSDRSSSLYNYHQTNYKCCKSIPQIKCYILHTNWKVAKWIYILSIWCFLHHVLEVYDFSCNQFLIRNELHRDRLDTWRSQDILDILIDNGGCNVCSH